MAEREIKLGLMTYRNEDGLGGCYGFQGDTVAVHPDDLERFDALNVQPGGDEPYDPNREPEDPIAGGGAERPRRPRKA